MPNHCMSILEVVGPEEDVQALKDLVKGEDDEDGEKIAFSCQSVIPMPERYNLGNIPFFDLEDMSLPQKDPIKEQMRINKLETGFCSWHDWHTKNWGSKWDVWDVGEWEETDRGHRVSFTSAWSPVVPVIEALAIKFPSLELTLKYVDEGAGFVGKTIFKNGTFDREVDYEWNNGPGIGLRQEVGYYWEEEEDIEPPEVDDSVTCRHCGMPISDADHDDNGGLCGDCVED